jgi:hypothetical protein
MRHVYVAQTHVLETSVRQAWAKASQEDYGKSLIRKDRGGKGIQPD